MFFCFSFWFYSKFVLEKAKKHATLHGKPYFLFPDVLKRWSFQKNCAGIWSFLYYRERWYFYFPKIWFYPQTENERWSFSKKYTEIWYFLQMFWKYGLFNKDCAGTWSFLHYLERWNFFPENMVFFPWTENEGGMTLLKKYTETWYFLFDMFHAPLRKKNQRRSYPAKIHLKVIDIPDRHPRKSSSNFLYLHGNLYRRFNILLSSKKKPGNLIY